MYYKVPCFKRFESRSLRLFKELIIEVAETVTSGLMVLTVVV